METYAHARVRTPPRQCCRTQARSPAKTDKAPKRLHTEDNVDTDAVFHAPMFALNADAERNACEPTTCFPQRCKCS
jgi:hypothetical protein